MTTKNYGAATSGYLDPDLRSWENAVYEAGKPVLDKEMNLMADLAGGFGLAALRRAMPSGWISDDFLSTSSHSSAVFVASAAANTLQIPQDLTAHVNGWVLNIAHTGVSGVNQLTLTASPVGAGARRTDLVVLEVWRRLISASPDTTGKSASGRIWRHGNVKTSPSDDLTLNLTDDILDTNVGSESTKRVQIQYRLRVIPGVDLLAYPKGIDDPTAVAHTVPASAAAPDGTATLHTYSNQSANGDPGLWRAGDGNPANTLGTVDGYMYAIPLMAVFRRNSTAFDKNTNQNGGVATPGPSDRPDGLFYDVVDARDVADLRLGVKPTGWSYQEVLDKNVNLLLDNSLKTEWVLTGNGGGTVGHTVLWADEIGVSNAHGGDSVVTGDTPGAAFVGEFDAVRRRFSDRPVYEVMTVKVPMPVGGWQSATFNIDFTSITIHPYTAFNWAAYAPASVVVQDIVGATFIGNAAGKATFDAFAHLTRVENLGASPVAALDLTFDALTGLGVTDEDLYVDLLVCYPAGAGLTYTPTATYGASSFSINNPASLPATAPTSYSALANTAFDSAHREVHLQYTTVAVTFTFAADTVVSNKATFTMPERVQSITGVEINGAPIAGSTSVSADGRTVTLTNAADYTSPGDEVEVSYTALRPVPQSGVQFTIWYETRAPQTVRDGTLSNSLSLEPKYLPPHLYVITVGSGSQDEGYPFPHAYVQTGGVYPTSGGVFTGEHELSARAATSVGDFSSSTGFLKLPTFLPMVPNPESMTFERAPGDADFENRSYFKSVPGGAYVPNTYAQDLSDPAKHKVVYPLLAELTANTSFGQKGELVLVLLTRWASFDQTNGVYFDSNLAQNTTTASVFRLKGNLLNRRA